MKCSSAIILCALASAASSVSAWKQIDTVDGLRLLSSASSTNTKQTDGGPMTKATDTRPKVTNGGVNFYPYTNDIKNYIVQAHNSARASMVPSEAANMRQVSWDESLAIEAAELVNTCNFAHSTENYAYGQNLMYGGRTLDTSVVDSWMNAWVKDEISSGDRAGNGYMDLDHASAVLWATTYLVGCASKMCPNGYLTACNYYTPGNWQGERTYVPGKACSQCPGQAPYCDAQFGKLCTADKGTTPAPAPVPAPVPAPTPAATTPTPTPAQTNTNPTPTPANTNNNKPSPTPAATTPTPDATTQSPIQQDQTTTKTPSPAEQLPPADGAEDATEDPNTPTSTGKWSNVEASPATKPMMPGAIAALCGLFLMARAM